MSQSLSTQNTLGYVYENIRVKAGDGLTSHDNDLVLVTNRPPALHENIKMCYIYECRKANSNAGRIQTPKCSRFHLVVCRRTSGRQQDFEEVSQ